MELRHIYSFLVLSEKLHFRQAAELLFIVQPALTKQIKDLEAHLGVKLFRRDKRNVALTHEGVFFRERCKEMISQLEETKKELKWLADGTKGEVRIGYVGSCIHTFLPGFLTRANNSYPGLLCYLNEMTTKEQEMGIFENTLDIAFLRNPVDDSRYETRIVFREPFALVVPSGHAVSIDNFEGLHQFKDEQFILPSAADGSTYGQIQQSICHDAGFSPRIAHETVHGHTVLKMVEHNLGVGLLPLSFRQFANKKLRFMPLQKIPQRSEISLMWSKENRNPCLHRLVEMI